MPFGLLSSRSSSNNVNNKLKPSRNEPASPPKIKGMSNNMARLAVRTGRSDSASSGTSSASSSSSSGYSSATSSYMSTASTASSSSSSSQSPYTSRPADSTTSLSLNRTVSNLVVTPPVSPPLELASVPEAAPLRVSRGEAPPYFRYEATFTTSATPAAPIAVVSTPEAPSSILLGPSLTRQPSWPPAPKKIVITDTNTGLYNIHKTASPAPRRQPSVSRLSNAPLKYATGFTRILMPDGIERFLPNETPTMKGSGRVHGY